MPLHFWVISMYLWQSTCRGLTPTFLLSAARDFGMVFFLIIYNNHRIVEYQVRRDLTDHLVQPYLAKTWSRQDGPAPCVCSLFTPCMFCVMDSLKGHRRTAERQAALLWHGSKQRGAAHEAGESHWKKESNREQEACRLAVDLNETRDLPVTKRHTNNLQVAGENDTFLGCQMGPCNLGSCSKLHGTSKRKNLALIGREQRFSCEHQEKNPVSTEDQSISVSNYLAFICIPIKSSIRGWTPFWYFRHIPFKEKVQVYLCLWASEIPVSTV